MALISCGMEAGALSKAPMDDEPWQRRAKMAGLNQKTLAHLLGVAENTVSLQLRGRWQSGTPQYVKTVIRAWERLSPDARQELLQAVEGDDPPR